MPHLVSQGHCPAILPQLNLATETIDALNVTEQEIYKILLNETNNHLNDKHVSSVEGQSGDTHIDSKNTMTAQRTRQDQLSVTKGSVGNSNSDKKQSENATVEFHLPHSSEPEVDRSWHHNLLCDSATEVTILSDKVYQSHQPPKLREVTLLLAGRNMALKGFVVGPVQLKIGDRWYKETVYIAPI